MYAVGEIVLVVIGILFALQINALNQSRQRAKLEKVLLNQVRFEILETYEDIWRDVGVLANGDKSYHEIRKSIEQKRSYTDTMCFDFYWMTMDEYIYPTNAAYTRLKEEGLDIIKNDSIRIFLQSLYEGYFPRLLKSNSFTPDISTVFHDYYLHHFKPNTDLTLTFGYLLQDDTVGSRIYADVSYEYPKRDLQHGSKYTIGYVPLDFEALKKDPKFHMLMEQTKRYRNNKLRHYKAVTSTIKRAITKIESELKE